MKVQVRTQAPPKEIIESTKIPPEQVIEMMKKDMAMKMAHEIFKNVTLKHGQGPDGNEFYELDLILFWDMAKYKGAFKITLDRYRYDISVRNALNDLYLLLQTV